MRFSLESAVRPVNEVLFRDLGGEAVVLNLATGRYYGLDEVGARMWALLVEHQEVQAAYRGLLDEFDVGELRLQQDLLRFVEELVSHGLLELE